MSKPVCIDCSGPLATEVTNYRYDICGVPNVVLQGIEVSRCLACGEEQVSIPRMTEIHRTIALGLIQSPFRLTGAQFRYLRKYLELTGDQLGQELGTDRMKISKWERGEDPIGDRTDRLMRMVVAALGRGLADSCTVVAQHLTRLADGPGDEMELHVDVTAMTFAHLAVHAV